MAYHLAGSGWGTATFKFYEGRDILGTIPGGVASLGAGNVDVVTAGVESICGGPMGKDATSA